MGTVLQTSEYDISYFDGNKTALKHNAGYSKYERHRRYDGVSSLGEFWLDMAKKLFDDFALFGKKVLEIGCSKGFIVQDLRGMGVDCYGLDVSAYAVGQAVNIVKPYLTIGDARTSLSGYATNEFDFLFSLRFLECIADADLAGLVSEINRISKAQYHTIDEFIGYPYKTGAAQYYNSKVLTDWLKYSFSKGAKFVSQEDDSKTLTK